MPIPSIREESKTAIRNPVIPEIPAQPASTLDIQIQQVAQVQLSTRPKKTPIPRTCGFLPDE